MHTLVQRLKAVLFQRCPHCLRGKAFDGLIDMRERCPVCGYKFEIESGYFIGAMYASYFLAIPVIALLALAIHWLFLPSWQLYNAVLVALFPFLFLVPIIFRYSRVVWMHFDHPWVPAVDPTSSEPAVEPNASLKESNNGKEINKPL
jgi:uncharacterized protein (DUF983 family)